MRGAMILVILGFLSGCAAPAPQASHDARAPASPSWIFGQGVAATHKCADSCFEATVAADGAGRLLATGSVTSPLGLSLDQGRTWTIVPPPALPPGIRGIQTDVIVQRGPAGRIYYSALIFEETPLRPVDNVTHVSTNFIEGIQVAWTADGGATWPVNSHLSPQSDPRQIQAAASDRQWLGFALDGTAYVTFTSPHGTWIARSNDDAKTWSAFDVVGPVTADESSVDVGQLVVDSAGRLFIPQLDLSFEGVHIFESPDKGKTWTRVVAYAGAPSAEVATGGGAQWFATVAVAPDDSMHLAFFLNGDVLVVSSHDHGATWTKPVTWARGATSGPRLDAPANGTLALMWYEAGDQMKAHLSQGTENGPGQDAILADNITTTIKGANTDYADFTRLPDGRIAAVFSSASEKVPMVAVQR